MTRCERRCSSVPPPFACVETLKRPGGGETAGGEGGLEEAADGPRGRRAGPRHGSADPPRRSCRPGRGGDAARRSPHGPRAHPECRDRPVHRHSTLPTTRPRLSATRKPAVSKVQRNSRHVEPKFPSARKNPAGGKVSVRAGPAPSQRALKRPRAVLTTQQLAVRWGRQWIPQAAERADRAGLYLLSFPGRLQDDRYFRSSHS